MLLVCLLQLFGLGVANIAGSFFSIYPTTGESIFSDQLFNFSYDLSDISCTRVNHNWYRLLNLFSPQIHMTQDHFPDLL